jgi:hypothetical protein
VVFTGFSAALGALMLLAAATVIAVPELPGEFHDNNYRTAVIAQPGLRPGVVATLLLIAVPILALAGQCVRFGSPSRDRRLAAIRLAGATPRQTVLIAAAETTIAALLGSLSGLVVYAVLRWALNRPGPDGVLPLPTDVLPSITAFVVILLIVPVLAGLAAAFLLRKVIITPFGVVRQVRDHRPSVVPGVLIIAGVFSPFVIKPFGHWLYDLGAKFGITVATTAIVLLVVAAILGVILGTGWITFTTGRILHRFAHRPGALLAGRQLMADPWSGSRTFAALLTTVIIGAGVYGYRSLLTTQFEASAKVNEQIGNGDGSGYDTGFYLGTISLINLTVEIGAMVAAIGILIALAEGIVSRRRTYAALVATGVPRRTLGAAIAWQTLAPLVPAVLVALTVGFSLVRTLASTVTEGGQSCTGDGPSCVTVADVTLPVPVPVGELALLGGSAMAMMILVVGAGLLFLRMSTDVTELRV